MKRKQKIPMVRFCVTLPETLVEYYRHVAEETGLSVSKIILVTLRSKEKNVILLPLLYQETIQEFNRLIADAIARGAVTPELKHQITTLEYLARRADILVDKKGANYYAKT